MSSEITVKLNGESRVVPHGTVVRDVLGGIPSRDLVAASIDGKVVDLTPKLEHDSTVEPVLADSPEGLDVIRHSTPHLIAMPVQAQHPASQDTHRPVLKDGICHNFGPATPFTQD